MKKRSISISRRAIAASLATLMMLTPMSALAAPATGVNITSTTIPVTATIDSYYEIGTPFSGAGNLNLTRAYNEYVTSDGDTNGTFYGLTSISIKGNIDASKKVACSLTCADLVKTGETGTTAAVGMRALSSGDATKATSIWGGSTANTLSFGSTAWIAGTTGSNVNFLNTEVNPDTLTHKYLMLRTSLPKDGTYTSNLVINFALADA